MNFLNKLAIYINQRESGQSKELIELTLSSSKKVSALDNQWKRPRYEMKDVESSTARRINALIKNCNRLELDEDNLRISIRTLLRGINTLKRLREEWPDGEAYYKSFIPAAPTKNVPAVRGTDIMRMISELGGNDV